MTIHPAIKLICLLLVSFFATQGTWFTLLVTGALMLPFYFVHSFLWTSAIKMLLKLKWFFLSIILVYFFFTPGNSETFSWEYYYSALIPAFFRVSVLIIILFAVNLYIKTSTKNQILSALLWVLTPLSWINLDIQRMSLRAVLTMEYIEDLNYQLSQYKLQNKAQQQIPEKDITNHSSLNKWSQFLYRKKKDLFQLSTQSGIILRDIIAQADTTSGKTYTLSTLQRPVLWQFFVPVMVILLLLATF